MKKTGKLGVFALTLVLVLLTGLAFPVFAASGSDSETFIPETEEAGFPASPHMANDPVVPPGELDDGTEDPEDAEDSESFFAKYWEKYWEDVVNLPGKIWTSLEGSMESWAYIGGGRAGMLAMLEDGGRVYATELLNYVINAIYGSFYVIGVVIMLICFFYALSKGYYSLSLGDKNSIVKPVIGLIITLFAFSVAKDVMSVVFSMSLSLTGRIVGAIKESGLVTLSPTIESSSIINLVLQLVLMLNIAKVALMQCTAPLYIGFAPAENSRRVMINLAKEYGKCCLVPPITAVYAIITFCIADATLGIIASIVIAFSMWTIGSKYLDKIFN